MAKNVQGARMMMKRSTTTGQVPTEPKNDDHTFGWESTDIYLSELYMNVVDAKVFTRSTAGITQFVLTDPSTGQIDPEYLSVPIENNAAFALLMSTGGTESIHAIPELTYDTATTTLTLAGTGKFNTIYEGGTSIVDKYFSKTSNNNFSASLNYTPDAGTILSMDNKEIINRHNVAGGLSLSSGNGSGSNLLIGTGDAVSKMEAPGGITLSSGEDIHIGADFNIYFYSNTNSGWGFRKTASFADSGLFNAPVIAENGTQLSAKYLGINDTADNSLALGGQIAANWLRSNINATFSGSEFTVENDLILSALNTGAQTNILGINSGSGEVTMMSIISDPANNRVLTSNGTNPNQAQAESSLLYNGVTLINGTGSSTTTIAKGYIETQTQSGGYIDLRYRDTGLMTRLQTISSRLDISLATNGSPGSLISVLRLNSNGDLTITGDINADNYPPISDIRLKNKEEDITSTLNNLLKLETIKFNWKYKDEGSHYGLIAQDVEKYFPETIIEKEQFLQNDNNGKIYKAINYYEFVPIIINSMKEQQVIIDDLKKEIELLKNK